MKKAYAIIEVGSNNTKTFIYEKETLIYEKTTTIEFKKNYELQNKINQKDFEKLMHEIDFVKSRTDNLFIFGCSIFRKIQEKELKEINDILNKKYHQIIHVVSQEQEALYTAQGCYEKLQWKGNICIFIGGGGSSEMIIVNNEEIVERKYLNFGVVDITKKYPSLKEDIPTVPFEEVTAYIDSLIGNLETKCEILILAGGDHLYWYNNAGYKLLENTLYQKENQKFMITREMSDEYDKDAYKSSLDKIRNNSDNPAWFDGSRAMKAMTNVISHKIDAKYLVPTKINMEEGIRNQIINDSFHRSNDIFY